MIKDKKVEIFCGTGGVGKTTLSCSRAIKLASMGKKVLLITIDPSKRLKQVIGLNDEDIGQSKAVDCSLFDMNNISFDALLMSPYSTLKRFTKKFRDTEEGIGNPLLEVLGRPNGGLNEILSIVELQYQMELNKYDTIVLDTAPGSHFIDFLNTGQKITNFFDKSFIDIFKFLKSDNKKSGLFSGIIETGVKKLLGLLEKVTGGTFVEQFVDAVYLIYQLKDPFLDTLKFQESIKDISASNWFFVTSTEQNNLIEAKEIQQDAIKFAHDDNFVIINKCLETQLNKWTEFENVDLEKLKRSLLKKEQQIKAYASENFYNILEFPDIIAASPREHVKELSSLWT